MGSARSTPRKSARPRVSRRLTMKSAIGSAHPMMQMSHSSRPGVNGARGQLRQVERGAGQPAWHGRLGDPGEGSLG